MAFSAPPQQIERHVSLRGKLYVCDICGDELNEEEPVVALAGNANSTVFKKGFIDPFGSSRGYQPHVKCGKWRLCRAARQFCSMVHKAATQPGSVIHSDCLQVFMRNCSAEDALDRLWQTCTWRRVPWTCAVVPELHLSLRPVWYWVDSFLFCAQISGLPTVSILPQEVVGIVMESLPRCHLFWRYVSALDLARRLSNSQLQPLTIVPLNQVVSWERGTAPKLDPEGSIDGLAPIIRLIIDHDGLRKLERLQERPDFSQQRFDNQAFVVEDESFFGAPSAKFKNGLLQLSMSNYRDFEHWGLEVWDTPTPPNLDNCLVSPGRPSPWFRFHTIDLLAITGITFFTFNNRIAAIHPHTRSQPCAMTTYTTIEDETNVGPENWCVWVYVPLPRQDTVLSCGPLVYRYGLAEWRVPRGTAENWPYFLIRTRLSGDVAIWRHPRDNANAMLTHAYYLNALDEPPRTLCYSAESRGYTRGTSIMIPLDQDGEQSGMTEEPPAYPPADLNPDYQHSYAPLENVARIRVFYRPGTMDYYRGILLYYDNGGQRALGECRLHVDRSETYIRPSSIAFINPPEYEDEGVKVRFNGPGGLDEGTWLHYSMTGKLEWWCIMSFAKLSVEGGTLIPHKEKTTDDGGESMLAQLADSDTPDELYSYSWGEL